MFEVQYLIYIYITLCVAMMIFNWLYMIYNDRSKNRIKKRNKKLIRKIDLQISLVQGSYHVSPKHKKYLEQKLKKVSNLYILEEALSIYEQKYVEIYIQEIQVIFTELCKIYEKKDTISKSYFAYIVGKYKIGGAKERTPITNFLFKIMEEEEIYCIDNAIIAFYKLGNLRNILRAIDIINNKDSYQNINIIEKGLLIYEGDRESFTRILWDRFDNYDVKVKVAIINYITKLSSGDFNDKMYELIAKTRQPVDIKIAIVKYFSIHYDDRIKEILYKILELPLTNNIDYIITAIRTLRNYGGEETIERLKVVLQRNQWNIQIEASETLNYLGANYIQLADIYNGENQKARKILRYVSSKQRRKES